MPRKRNPDLLRQIGARLRAAREARGWSQQRLAEELDVQVPLVSRFERGQTGPSLATLWSAADALGIPVGALIDGPGAHAYEAPEGDPAIGDITRAYLRLSAPKRSLLLTVARAIDLWDPEIPLTRYPSPLVHDKPSP